MNLFPRNSRSVMFPSNTRYIPRPLMKDILRLTTSTCNISIVPKSVLCRCPQWIFATAGNLSFIRTAVELHLQWDWMGVKCRPFIGPHLLRPRWSVMELSSYVAAPMTFSSAKNCSKVRISLDSKNFRDEQTPALHLVPACLLLPF